MTVLVLITALGFALTAYTAIYALEKDYAHAPLDQRLGRRASSAS